MNRNIILCGVGGQGTVLASRLIAAASMARGYQVMSAETIGMAQRGGSVFSCLRISDREELYAPMIGEGDADVILGFEPGETVRMLPYRKPEGVVVTATEAIRPTTATLSGSSYGGREMIAYLEKVIPPENLVLVDGSEAVRTLGNAKVLNVVLLGAAVRSGALGLSEEDIGQAMERLVKKNYLELNRRALHYTAAAV